MSKPPSKNSRVPKPSRTVSGRSSMPPAAASATWRRSSAAPARSPRSEQASSMARSFIEHPAAPSSRIGRLVPAPGARVAGATNVTTLRATLSVLGDGFVEAIATARCRTSPNNQPSSQRGQLISVPVLERPGTTRVGRFGWKDQQASLLSFSADAYKNEMGITSPLDRSRTRRTAPRWSNSICRESTTRAWTSSSSRSSCGYQGAAVNPLLIGKPRRAAGSPLFNNIGCAVCHTRTIVTAAPGP